MDIDEFFPFIAIVIILMVAWYYGLEYLGDVFESLMSIF